VPHVQPRGMAPARIAVAEPPGALLPQVGAFDQPLGEPAVELRLEAESARSCGCAGEGGGRRGMHDRACHA